MTTKGTARPVEVTDKAEYLRNKIFRRCRRGHLWSDEVWERLYNDAEANCQYVARCTRGCGYEVAELWYRDPKTGEKTLIRRRSAYTDKSYLARRGRITSRDAKEADIDEIFEREAEDRRKLATRKRRASGKAAAPKAGGSSRAASTTRKPRSR